MSGESDRRMEKEGRNEAAHPIGAMTTPQQAGSKAARCSETTMQLCTCTFWEEILMSLTQAILLGMIYWINTISMGYGATTIWNAPLCVVLWVGLIMGDVPTAMKVGAMVQPMFLAFTSAGGTVANDKCAAGLVPAAVVCASGMSFDAAVALSVTVALLLAQLHTIRRIVAATWVHMADAYAEKCNIRGIFMAGLVYTNLAKIIIFWIPMTLMLYFGAEFIGNLMNSLPEWLENGLTVTGKMMPALGYAMTINVIGRKDLLPYFIGGFFFAKYSGLATMPLACTALFIAFLDMRFSKTANDDEGESILSAARNAEIAEEEESGKRLLDKKDIRGAWIRWWWSCEQSNSFERLQSLAFCICMAPILKKLWPDNEEELRAGLKRHLVFFNTQGIWGAVVHGIVISMEEQRAMGVAIDPAAITGVKTGLMGPFAGIGDTIDWSTIQPLALAFCIPYGLEGKWWAAIVPWLVVFTITQFEGYNFMKMGYRLGTRAAVSILQSGQVQRIITFFSVLGLFMMGSLAAGMVDVQIKLAISTSGTPMYIQKDILDKIIPGLLSILTVFAVYGYLKKGGNMMKATFWILGFGMLLGCLGILGTPAVA